MKMIRRSAPYFAAGLLCSGLFLAARRAALFRSREQRILRRFFRTVERNFNVLTGDGVAGLFEIASATGNSNVHDFVAIYAGAVYCDRRLTDDEYVQLRKILRNMEGVKSKIP